MCFAIHHADNPTFTHVFMFFVKQKAYHTNLLYSPVISKIMMDKRWINNVVDKQHDFIVSIYM